MGSFKFRVSSLMTNVFASSVSATWQSVKFMFQSNRLPRHSTIIRQTYTIC